jgi:pimeloyl-ACP methyl ester carboxylesterase
MRDFRVIAPDIPGEAGRSGHVRPSWENDKYVQWLDDLMGSIGVDRAALLGLCLGGWIAARFAAHRPGRVSRLVMLAPAGVSPARTSAVLKTILYSMQKEKGAEKLKRLVFGPGDIWPEVSRFFDLLQQHNAPRFGAPRLPTDAEIRSIACPVLMMYGGGDAFFSAGRTIKRLTKLLPGVERFETKETKRLSDVTSLGLDIVRKRRHNI